MDGDQLNGEMQVRLVMVLVIKGDEDRTTLKESTLNRSGWLSAETHGPKYLKSYFLSDAN